VLVNDFERAIGTLLIGRPLPIDNYAEIVGIASPPPRRAELAG
jgi:hypothetical protein